MLICPYEICMRKENLDLPKKRGPYAFFYIQSFIALQGFRNIELIWELLIPVICLNVYTSLHLHYMKLVHLFK